MKRVLRQWLAGLLSVVLAFTLLPATAWAEEAGGTTGQTVEQVQALIDALSDADTITADNRADVEAQLNAIDAARLWLTGDEAAALDTTRYDAAVEAIQTLDDMAGANEPRTMETVSDVTYLGWNNDQTKFEEKTCNSATKVESGTTAWNENWYVVSESVIVSDRIAVSGDVNLILADGYSLTASKGITVTEGNSLTIWGQSQGSGKLIATGKNDWFTGIGNDSQSNKCGTIIINGGTIDATGGGWTAGIGGEGATITINGGNVKASGGNNGAGIGGVSSGSQGFAITITGGTVDAHGAQNGAGIGNGAGSTGENEITITGGFITADSENGPAISGDFSTETDGTAVIVYDFLDDTTTGDDWRGIFISGSGTEKSMDVYGNQTLAPEISQKLPSVTLKVKENASLTVVGGAELKLTGDSVIAGNGNLVNSGTITNNGTVTNNGSVENQGEIVNHGSISGDGSFTGDGTITENPLRTSCELIPQDLRFSVGKNYTPSEMPIEIYNSGPEKAVIEKIEVQVDAQPFVSSDQISKVFEIIQGTSTVEVEQTNTSWKIKPVEGLPVGLYAGTITITYNGIKETNAVAFVTFMVFLNGDGTQSAPFLISDQADLKAFQAYINNDSGAGQYFKLTDDIDLENKEWTPIGNRDHKFQGTFDGNGRTISNLYVTSKFARFDSGLFGYIGSSGTVKNLSVSGFVSGNSSVGGIAGNNYGTISNCDFSGTVTSESDSENAMDVGGITSYNEGSIINCSNSGTITSKSIDVGGIVGDNRGAVTNCSNSGEITGTDANTQTGGITGSSVGKGALTGCINTGNINAVNYPAGIVAHNRGTISNCYNTGSISGSGNYPGGIVGHNEEGAITNCYNSGSVSGISLGSIVGSAYKGTITNCYFLSGSATSSVGSGSHIGEATEKSTVEFSSGEVAWLLQNGQKEETQVWGQDLSSDTKPVLTTESSKSVCKVTFQSLGTEYFVMYANPSNLTALPAEPSKAGFTFAGWSTKDGGPADFTAETPVNANTTVYAVWKPDFEGSGTADAPYLIPDKATLEAFRDYVNAGKGDGEYFKLTNNINLEGGEGNEWTPIGSSSREFQGTFDGDGHTISGLFISFGSYVGLFGCLGESGTVKNLTVEGNVAGTSSVGGIVGRNNGGTINSCHNAAAVTSYETAGGIVGFSNGIVTNCYNTATVTGNSQYIGGIVGHVTYGSVTNCYNTAIVTGGYGDYSVGGIIGFNSSCTVTNCYYLSGTATSGIGGDGEATEKTADQFASGEVAWLLQKDQDSQVWGQTVKTGYPELTDETSKKVYQITGEVEGQDPVVWYSNSTATLPAAPVKAGFTFEGWSTTQGGSVNFKTGTQVTADTTVYAIFKEIPSSTDAALQGKVTQDGEPVANADVTLKQNGKTVGTTTSGEDGTYSFENAAPGVYDVVVEKDGKTMTSMVTVTGDTGTEKDLAMPKENVSSVLDTQKATDSVVAVGGLDSVAQEHASTDSTVTVTMTVESKTESTADHARDIKSAAEGRELDYMAIELEKETTTGGAAAKEPITETTQLITIVLRFDFTGKSNVVVYRYHDTAVDTLTESKNVSGEYIVLDETGGTITLHVKNFSTYAIGYTQAGQTPTPPTPPAPSGSFGTPSYGVAVPSRTEGGSVRTNRAAAQPGSSVTLTVKPDEGYHFGSLAVTDRNGKPVEVTDNGDGTYTFTMPYGQVTVEAEFTKCGSLGFADLDTGAWYHDYADYVINHGLMRGSGGLFEPGGTVTRAQMVTVLWNMSGKPVVNYYMTYSDVMEDAWYAEAIRWAASERIANGYGNGKFGPDDSITREQMAAMVYRYEQKYGDGGFTGDWMYRLPFTDLDQISDWAFEAVAWCNMEGVITGKDSNIFDPKGPAKRSEMAAILTRYLTQDK